MTAKKTSYRSNDVSLLRVKSNEYGLLKYRGGENNPNHRELIGIVQCCRFALVFNSNRRRLNIIDGRLL